MNEVMKDAEYVFVCDGGEYTDQTLATASWWDQHDLVAGEYVFTGLNIRQTPVAAGEEPYWYELVIDSVLKQERRVNRLFSESRSQDEFPQRPAKVHRLFYGFQLRDGLAEIPALHGRVKAINV